MLNNSEKPFSDLERLASQVADGCISAEKKQELVSLIGDDIELHKAYVEYLTVHALLRRELGAFQSPLDAVASELLPVLETANSQVISMWDDLSTGHRFSTIAMASGWMLAFLLGGILWFSSKNFVEQRQQPLAGNSQETIEIQPVAFLTYGSPSNENRFGSIGTPVQISERIELIEGIAEFRMTNGVSLSIEGPASLVFESASTITLDYGKLTFYSSSLVKDFKICSAGMEVSSGDFDAECGIRVTHQSLAVHSFSGNTIIRLLDTPYPLAQGQVTDDKSSVKTVKEGKALLVQILRGACLWNSATQMKANEAEFTNKLCMADELPVTQAYVDEVMKSKPFGYWRCETNDSGIVRNEIPGGVDLEVFGTANITQGALNGIAEFGRPGLDSFLISTAPVGLPRKKEFSIELWVKPSHVHLGALVVLLRENEAQLGDHAFYLDVNGVKEDQKFVTPAHFHMMHRDPPSTSYIPGVRIASKNPYRLRRWQHVVVSKHKTKLQMYVDKKLAATTKDNASLAENLYLLIGQTHLRTRGRGFVGQMDELAIYDRALSKAEIADHFNAVWESEVK